MLTWPIRGTSSGGGAGGGAEYASGKKGSCECVRVCVRVCLIAVTTQSFCTHRLLKAVRQVRPKWEHNTD